MQYGTHSRRDGMLTQTLRNGHNACGWLPGERQAIIGRQAISRGQNKHSSSHDNVRLMVSKCRSSCRRPESVVARVRRLDLTRAHLVAGPHRERALIGTFLLDIQDCDTTRPFT